jgi:hypothetical protein
MNSATTLWEAYRERIYGNDSLPLTQERECSLAFYAGMESAFWRLSDIANEVLDTKETAKNYEKFRIEIKTASMHANLDRATGTS